ncbi:MAG: hypothetical protein CMP48_10000 [Rickettsiales bacterium]|nr:hypothetical protein [Rickettsiales bacterium]
MLVEITPNLGGSTFVDSVELEEFMRVNENLPSGILEEELLFNFYYPDECACWGDGFYNCVSHTISASSSLPASNSFSYHSSNLIDLDLRTGWVEGVSGYGVGESITIDVEMSPANSVEISTLVIVNGYVKNEEVWRKNSRVQQFKLYIDDQPKALLNLLDVENYQLFDIQSIVSGLTSFEMKLEITKVNKGDLYEDTVISEIFFKGTGCM